jgi:hypothetical protein
MATPKKATTKKATPKAVTSRVRARRTFVPAGGASVAFPAGQELPDEVVKEGDQLPDDDPRVVAQPWEFEPVK